MRIVSGDLGGRVFPEKIPPGIRPTTDRTRETIFNILNNHLDFEDIKAADICAGSGALGFEAISRGIRHSTFFEKSRRATEYIKDTASSFKIPESNYTIIFGDALHTIEKLSYDKESNQFDLVFIDPPYQLHINGLIIETLYKASLLPEGSIIVSESSIADSLILPKEFSILADRIIGATKVVFYIKEI